MSEAAEESQVSPKDSLCYPILPFLSIDSPTFSKLQDSMLDSQTQINQNIAYVKYENS